MSPKPTSPSSLLRSLGADESFFEAKQKASAREAEQRWPLFRALAPTKSEIPPALSDEEKRAWEQAKPAATQARKPLLSRPGLSSKLAASLEKFAKAPSASAQKKPRAVKTSSTDAHIATPVTSAVRAKSTAPTKKAPVSPHESESLSPTPPLASATAPARANQRLPSQGSSAHQLPPGAGGLFARTVSDPTTTKAGGRSSDAGESASKEIPPTAARRVAPLQSAEEPLTDLFNRVEGKTAPARNARTGNSTNSVMRRIGKR
jgi:hypothetical protein